VRTVPTNSIIPQYVTAHANEIIPLSDRQDMELRSPSQGLLFGRGDMEFRWSPNNSIHFNLGNLPVKEIFKLNASNEQDVILNVPTNPPISLDVRINGSSFNIVSGGESKAILLGLVSETRFDKEILCDELKFHIVNLHNFIGRSIDYPPHESSQSSAARRIALSDDNWDITIDGVENLKELLDELAREGGYAITHVGILRKRDNQPFRASEALEQMALLGFFLSFVEGRWCHPIFLIGLRKGEIIFRDLSSRHRVTQWDTNWRWSPSEANYLDLAYKGFVSKWNDPNWRETIALILEFYIRANIYHVVELSVLDSFTAMDRFASAYSLENVGSANERIRRTLALAGMDRQRPNRELCIFFEEFYNRYCPPRKIADGATILTDFRHGVVHGNRGISTGDERDRMKNRPKLDDDSDATNPILPFPLRIHAMQYGLWCVEMSLLYLIGYNGRYNDRITRAQDVLIHWSTP